MKQLLFSIATATMLASAMLASSSCEKQAQPEPVSVMLTYTIASDNGSVMNGTKASNADVFNEFYQKILSGELVAPTYNLVFTEKTTGTVYTVTGNWSSKDMVTLRTGSYSVVGTSTAEGADIQEKCSLKFADEIIVDTNSQTITLKATYDCSLIVFSDTSIASLNNFNGITSTPLFKFSSYLYAFIKSQLYAESHQADAYLAGKHTNNTEFKIYTGNLNYETGKYYVYNDINTAFSLERMEEGGAESSNNLSASGTANCYIVPSSGEYKFKASVKGNSTESVGDPAKAEVIWETFNTNIKPNVGDIVKDVKYSDGYITFTATGKEGNALIAVKNASDVILWSWHIWVTDYIPEEEFETYVTSGICSMNRNLGALSNTKGSSLSFGLLYQRGRKDPFLATATVNAGLDVVCEPYSSTQNVNIITKVNANDATIEYSISNPNKYIYCDGGGWLGTNIPKWENTKAKYDPCPVGWKVIPSSVWKECYASFSWNSDYCGMSLPSSICKPEPWFPAVGGLDKNGIRNVGPYCLYYASDSSVWMHYGGYVEYQAGTANTSGYPTRCCKE